MLLVRVPQQRATRSLSGWAVALPSLGFGESRQRLSYNKPFNSPLNTPLRSVLRAS